MTSEIPEQLDVLPGYPLSAVVVDNWQESHQPYNDLGDRKIIIDKDKSSKNDSDKFKSVSVGLDMQVQN